MNINYQCKLTRPLLLVLNLKSEAKKVAFIILISIHSLATKFQQYSALITRMPTKIFQMFSKLISFLGYNTCTLVAHDWGGAVAWRVALAHPEMLDKLIILNCPHPTAFRKLLYGNYVQMLKSWFVFLFLFF